MKRLVVGSRAELERHAFGRKLLALVRTGQVRLIGGRVERVDIFHDDWCALNFGGRYCDCDPEIITGQREAVSG